MERSEKNMTTTKAPVRKKEKMVVAYIENQEVFKCLLWNICKDIESDAIPHGLVKESDLD